MFSKKIFPVFLAPLLITLGLWFLTDAIATYLLGIRGFSSFFIADPAVGQINKQILRETMVAFLIHFLHWSQ